MWCRCNMCMEEFSEEAIDTVLDKDDDIIELCPFCGRNGYIMDLGEYVFEMCNGNAGRVEHFMTEEEAIEAAEIKWSHLTPRERVAYTDRSRRGIFQVYDDDGHIYRDWKDEADADDRLSIYRRKARR